MAEPRRVYIDTCCFIDLARVEIKDRLDTDRENDAWHIKKLMEAHRDGEIRLFTSAITIVECRHGGQNPPSEEIKSQFSRLLMSGQYVQLVQPTPFIMVDGRDLTWVHGLNIKGADSIHVASALDRKCEEFLTSNGRLARFGQHGSTLQRLGLACKPARETQCLPTKYRQLELSDGATAH
jgi:predicted nucleic acid-binding protein